MVYIITLIITGIASLYTLHQFPDLLKVANEHLVAWIAAAHVITLGIGMSIICAKIYFGGSIDTKVFLFFKKFLKKKSVIQFFKTLGIAAPSANTLANFVAVLGLSLGAVLPISASLVFLSYMEGVLFVPFMNDYTICLPLRELASLLFGESGNATIPLEPPVLPSVKDLLELPKGETMDLKTFEDSADNRLTWSMYVSKHAYPIAWMGFASVCIVVLVHISHG